MSSTDSAAVAPARPKRPPPRPAMVTHVERLTPRVIRLRLAGEALAAYTAPKPSAHFKLFIEEKPGTWREDSDMPRPPSRTYTPRRFDPAGQTLDVEFVLHGEGLASDWASTVKPGDPALIGQARGGFDPDPGLRHIVMLADESALPAAGTILEALPAGCTADLHCEIEASSEARPLSPTATADPHWLLRDGAAYSAKLEAAVGGIDAPDDALWWVACEAGAMRRIRAHLLTERQLDKSRMITRGYWLAGERNHPDHDYGED